MREQTAGERGGRVDSGVRRCLAFLYQRLPCVDFLSHPFLVCALRLRFPFLLEVC